MGGGKRGRTQRRHFKQGRENVWNHSNKKTRSTDDAPSGEPNPNSKPNPSWEPFATRNPGFEEYYKEQGIVPEEEWEQFICVLQKPLPAAFRINSSGQFFQDIRAQLEDDFMKSLDEEINDENEVEAIRPLPWYPENLAWHLNFSRMQLRKNQTLERFHEFLKHENEVGNITRQEAVSMVPPLFLDVLPNHRVLDMCAAPGSKTFQLLEIIHQSTTLGSVPNGLVIANDVDVQRCNLLIHQTKRMCTANLIVTNHEAQHFPNCSLVGSHLETSKEDIRRNILQFDRILCDVPCSGDGTLRKAPDIWRKWNSGMGNGLHRLQVEIAMRGIALLRVGGRMVYSTCSMNPVENEAVVAEVLRRSRGSVVLLDVSSELPELVRRPGLKKWKVRDKGLWLTSFVDVPNYRRSLILPSMFSSEQSHNESPINDGTNSGTCEENIDSLSMQHKDVSSVKHASNSDDLENSMTLVDAKVPCETKEISNGSTPKENQAVDMEAEGSTFPLERCMRLLPHDQNSGAFFVAVLEKLSDVQALPHDSCGSSNKTRKVPTKKGVNVVDEQKSEIMSLENVSCQQHRVVAKESSDAELLMNRPLEIETEGGVALCPKYVSSEENDLEGAKTRDNEESGHVIPKGQKSKLQLQGKWRGVDPVVFFKDEVTLCSIRSFYGICESFPLENHLVTRSSDTDHVKRIYYISKSVQDILELNFQVGQRLKITSLGLKIFERQTSKDGALCSFRLSSEGLPLLLPYISKQIVCAPLVDFQHLLQYRVIKFADFVDADLREKSSAILSGCCVVVLNEGSRTADTVPADASSIAIICWKGKTNMSIMVSELDAKELLERLSVRFGVGTVAASSAEGVNVNLETGLMEEAEGTETMEDLDEC